MVPEMTVIGVRSLAQVVAVLRGEEVPFAPSVEATVVIMIAAGLGLGIGQPLTMSWLGPMGKLAPPLPAPPSSCRNSRRDISMGELPKKVQSRGLCTSCAGVHERLPAEYVLPAANGARFALFSAD